jgi:hypothetical protein
MRTARSALASFASRPSRRAASRTERSTNEIASMTASAIPVRGQEISNMSTAYTPIVEAVTAVLSNASTASTVRQVSVESVLMSLPP